MAKKRWFDKFVGCAFYLFDDMTGGNAGEYVFCGTCEHSDHDNGRDLLQYEFCADGKPQILLSYKEARQVMGAMIDRITYGKKIKPSGADNPRKGVKNDKARSNQKT